MRRAFAVVVAASVAACSMEPKYRRTELPVPPSWPVGDAYLRQTEPPFVILLDLTMPVMNGWQFRQEQQQDPVLALIPVVVLSGESDLPRVAARLGVAGHFPKPVEFTELLATIRVLGEEPPVTNAPRPEEGHGTGAVR